MGLNYKARSSKAKAVAVLPKNHKLGLKVTKGGSMCANCKFLDSPTTCGNEGFIEWNDGNELPEPKDQYCCDLWMEPAK